MQTLNEWWRETLALGDGDNGGIPIPELKETAGRKNSTGPSQGPQEMMGRSRKLAQSKRILNI